MREPDLADRLRLIAIEVDTERERTGRDLTLRPALSLVEEWLAEGRNSEEIRRYGNRLGEEIYRLSLLPDRPPTYETYQVPDYPTEDDLPWD